MRIDREHVVHVLRDSGRLEESDRARRELGPEVDTDRDADLLRDLGIDPDSRARGGGLAVLSGGHPATGQAPT